MLVGFLASCVTPPAKLAQPPQAMLVIPGFEEPLVPIGNPSAAETSELKEVIASYFKQTDYYAGIDILDAFIKQHPDSAWRVALELNLGLIHYHNGAFSEAINSWEDAWKLGRPATGLKQKAMVDRVYGELARMHARLGHADRIAALLEEGKNRPLMGSATESIEGAKEGLSVMHNDPGIAYLCGPTALHNVLLANNEMQQSPVPAGSIQGIDKIDAARSGVHGFSLTQVNELAEQAGMPYQMAHREGHAPLPLPVVAHWKVEHYAAIVGEANGRYHVKDPTFGGKDFWMPKEVLDRESDGYFMIPKDKMGQGWRQVATAEADKVYGMGFPQGSDPDATTPCDDTNSESTCPCDCPGSDSTGGGDTGGGTGNGLAMPVYDVHSMLVSLIIKDTPVGYTPPKGAPMYVTLTYNQREYTQTGTIGYFNLGSKWTLNWLSYITDDPVNAGQSVTRAVSGGGLLDYSGYNSGTGAFTVESRQGATLVMTSASSYERRRKDGSKEIYSQSDGATTYPRHLFLKQLVDKSGNTVTLNYNYDSTNNLMYLLSVTDALSQTTTFGYNDSSNPLLITDITDPFSRTAHITYNSGQLASIRDAVSMTSSFTYVSGSDYINSMTTPYGTTLFDSSDGTTTNCQGTYPTRVLEVTDPYGNKERTAYMAYAPISNSDTAPANIYQFESGGVICVGDSNYLDARNTFYWDKTAYAKHYTSSNPGYEYAELKHWLHAESNAPNYISSGVLESIKHPLENRIWYNYPGQTGSNGSYNYAAIGTLDKPNKIGRFLDNGHTQATTLARDSVGNVIDYQVADYAPGSNTGTTLLETKYHYDTDNINLLDIKHTDNGTDYLYKSFTYGDSSNPHLPTTVTEYPAGSGSGHSTTYSYNSNGQVLTVTNPLSQTTTYAYSGGYLHTITDANSVVVATYTYDSVGRLYTSTNAAGYTLTYTYDNLNRLIHITYPDSTHTDFVYDKLDVVTVTDRYGDVKTSSYDNVRNLTSQNINTNVWAAGYSYYANGKPKYVTDGVGNVTAYLLDDQSRVTQVQRGVGTAFSITSDPTPNNSSAENTSYTYENTTSRLKTVTDALGDATNYSYDAANRITSVTDANNLVTSYTYNNLTQMTQVSPDSGTTVYYYDYLGRLDHKADARSVTTYYQYDSINRLTAIYFGSSPGSDTKDIQFVYDESGHGSSKDRLTSVIDNSSGTTEYSYDSYGRISAKTLLPKSTSLSLVTQYQYNAAGAVTQVTYPGGRVVTYDRTSDRLSDMVINYAGSQSLALDNVAYQPFGSINQFVRHFETGNTITNTQQLYANGGLYSRTFDINDSGSYAFTYGQDAYGNISTISDGLNPNAGQTFGYDAANRLVSATGDYGRYTYSYDATGNRYYVKLEHVSNIGDVTHGYAPADPLTWVWNEAYHENYLYVGQLTDHTDTKTSNRLKSAQRRDGSNLLLRNRTFDFGGNGNRIHDRKTVYESDGVTTDTDTIDVLSYSKTNRMSGSTVTDCKANPTVTACQ
jgi:YD repeat-containing protein